MWHMSTHENAQTSFLRRFAIFFLFSRFMTKNNHEFHYKSFVKQTFKRHLRCLSRDRESLYENDIIYSRHEENNCCWVDKNHFRARNAQIWRFKKSRFWQTFSLYQRLLNRHLLSHKDEETTKHRFSLADRWSNWTTKSKFRALFTNVLLRKTNRMSQISAFDRVRVSK
jgi:hypothetical protein